MGSDRITRSVMMMEMAYVVAKRATCSRASVGVVISRDGRIIGTGYNGAPAGMPHCDHTAEDEFLAQPPKILMGDANKVDWAAMKLPGKLTIIATPVQEFVQFKSEGCQVVEHAERNAIAFAARYGTALDGAEMTCTHAPCLACAKSIINAGIRLVTYNIPYRLTEGVELLERAGLKVIYMRKQF